MASLQTLGFICEELNPNDLTPETKNFVMLALTNNIGPAPEVSIFTKLAVKALLNCIPYMEQNFQVEAERNFIMQKIFEALKQQDEEIRENTL